MRASMAFPGLFAPVELDGRLLVDGGVAENFPVKTARKAGAEVLVAVNIGTPPAGKEKLTSLMKIINQVTSAATARNVKESKEAIGPQDVFIEPDLGDISFIDFKRVRDAVAAGEKAARQQIEELKKFSVPEAEYRAWRERTRRKPYMPFEISSIELVNPSPVSNAIVLSHVKTKPGPLDMKLLEEDLASINSIGEFDLVDFRIVPRGGGNVLQIVIKDRAWGRTSARFGINLDSDFKGNNGFELIASVTRTSVNRLGAEWRVVAGVGEITTIAGEFFQPLKVASPFFVSGVASWSDADAPRAGRRVRHRGRRGEAVPVGRRRRRRGREVRGAEGRRPAGAPLDRPDHDRGPAGRERRPRRRHREADRGQPGQRPVPQQGRRPARHDGLGDAGPRSGREHAEAPRHRNGRVLLRQERRSSCWRRGAAR